jgi:histidinol dehydrogenase
MKLRRLSTRVRGFDARLATLTHYHATADARLRAAVSRIIADVRRRGDAALLAYARRLDGSKAHSVAALELAPRLDVPRHQLQALRAAHARIKAFHERQAQASWEYTEPDGTRLGQRVTPLERVGIYVPGGKAAYPSTVLMNAVPARVAGVRELVMVSPNPSPLVLAAAAVAGVERVIGVGGAHAIAALACGTKRIARVDKIVGPGNAWVAEAKRQVYGEVGIDMIAGPSEILIISDGTTSAEWLAMDLFSQAEHDEDAQALLLSPDARHLDAVAAAMARLIDTLPRKRVIAASLRARGALIQTRDLDEACVLANRVAPEHIELSVKHPERILPRIRNAGAIFLGGYSSEAIGDYCAGPNHVLPTSGSARFSSPLGVYDFQKRSSLIAVSRAGAQSLGRMATVLAEGEGLGAHARAAQMRMAK